jgi:hypothetical protein
MAMTRAPRYTRAVDLPPEMQSISSLNAYESGRDHVRVACQLSDVHNEIGEVAILRISMDTMAVEVEEVFEHFSVAFHSASETHDILVETGGIVRRRSASGWDMQILEAKFLLGAFSLGGQTDFVFGDEGQIFRFDGRAWTRDAVDSDARIFEMHGIAPERLFAVGRDGLVLKAKGRNWETIDVAIGTDFRTVRAERERVIVAGDQGIAGYLADSEYVDFETGIETDILSVGSFRGKTYFADSDFGVHLLADGVFQPVANLGYTYRVNGAEHWLTAVCGEYIFQFDGSAWRGIEISYRDGYRAELYDMSFMG